MPHRRGDVRIAKSNEQLLHVRASRATNKKPEQFGTRSIRSDEEVDAGRVERRLSKADRPFDDIG